MKEIVERLQERRRIEQAKSILEAAGYIVNLENDGGKINEGFFVIDNTSIDKGGDSEKYHVSSEEEAKKKVEELVSMGSDRSKIKISPIKEEVEQIKADTLEDK